MNMLETRTTLNCRGKLLELSRPKVMAIINVTPDSFYEGSRYSNIDNVLRYAEKALTEGAAILDVGGMSTRPGATFIDALSECHRVVPVIEVLVRHFPDCMVSIDTVRAEVARAAAEVGAGMVNDVSAGRIDPHLFQTVADLGIPYVLMHSKGDLEGMKYEAGYTDVVLAILDFLIEKVGVLREMGVKDILIDPGFGFGKTLDDNYEILRKMHVFGMLDLPILVGISRKSMIYKLLNINAKQALNGTTAIHMIALQNGAKILRVHDVLAAMEAIKIYENTYIKIN